MLVKDFSVWLLCVYNQLGQQVISFTAEIM